MYKDLSTTGCSPKNLIYTLQVLKKKKDTHAGIFSDFTALTF